MLLENFSIGNIISLVFYLVFFAFFTLPKALGWGSSRVQNVFWWIGIIIVILVSVFLLYVLFVASILSSGSLPQLEDRYQSSIAYLLLPLTLVLLWPYFISQYFAVKNRNNNKKLSHALIYICVFATSIIVICAGILGALFS